MSETGIASPLGDSKDGACLQRSSRAAWVKNSMGSPRDKCETMIITWRLFLEVIGLDHSDVNLS
eukprot:3230460-Rhodomonas_salina.1